MTKTKVEVPPLISKEMGVLLRLWKMNVVCMHTEILVNGKICRAHPDYRKLGYWYDWGWIKFRPDNSEAMFSEDLIQNQENISNNVHSAAAVGLYPSKLLGFFNFQGTIHSLVHSCELKSTSEEDSCLTERWYLEYEKKKESQYNPQTGRKYQAI